MTGASRRDDGRTSQHRLKEARTVHYHQQAPHCHRPWRRRHGPRGNHAGNRGSRVRGSQAAGDQNTNDHFRTRAREGLPGSLGHGPGRDHRQDDTHLQRRQQGDGHREVPERHVGRRAADRLGHRRGGANNERACPVATRAACNTLRTGSPAVDLDRAPWRSMTLRSPRPANDSTCNGLDGAAGFEQNGQPQANARRSHRASSGGAL